MNIDPLTELTIELSKQDLDHVGRLTRICRSVARVLPQANRVSLWRLSDDLEDMQCIFMLIDGEVADASELTLTRSHYPEYFDAVLSDDAVCASDARNHPDTQCLTDAYFTNNGIYSLLAHIFRREFTPCAVICCEATQAPVHWQQRDIALLKRVAGIVSMFD